MRPGRFWLGERHRLAVRARDADHPVAEAFDQGLDVHGDERLVLDDQDVGGDLGRKLAAGFFHQAAQRRQVDLEHFGRVVLGKPSSATSRNACRGRGVIWVRCCSGARCGAVASGLPLRVTEFQILVNRRYSATR